jgi:hypothetical protein
LWLSCLGSPLREENLNRIATIGYSHLMEENLTRIATIGYGHPREE